VIGEKSSIEIDGWVKVGVAGFGDSESSSDVLICYRQIMEGDMLARGQVTNNDCCYASSLGWVEQLRIEL